MISCDELEHPEPRIRHLITYIVSSQSIHSQVFWIVSGQERGKGQFTTVEDPIGMKKI